MHSQNWVAERNAANTVACPDCHAPAGATCTRRDNFTGARVEVGFIAHMGRIKAAAKAGAR